MKLSAGEMIELSEEQLQMVAGGAWWESNSSNGGLCSCDGDDCLLTPGM